MTSEDEDMDGAAGGGGDGGQQRSQRWADDQAHIHERRTPTTPTRASSHLKRGRQATPSPWNPRAIRAQDLASLPQWYNGAIQGVLGVLNHSDQETYTRDEFKENIRYILERALAHERAINNEVSSVKREIQQLGQFLQAKMVTQEALDNKVQELAARCNPSYANALKINDKDFDPTVRTRQPDKPRHFLTVQLHFDDNRERNYEEVKDFVIKLIKPRQNNIRMTTRLSRNKNCVLEFPTKEEKAAAKAILTPTAHKVNDRADAKIAIWIQFAQALEGKTAEEIQPELRDLNPTMFANQDQSNIELKWIGREAKKLIALCSPKKAIEWLNAGYIYSEMERHPVVVLKPMPFRCSKCLQFHQTKADRCQNKRACRYCGDDHEHDSCPVRFQKQFHHCTTCAHYKWDPAYEHHGQHPHDALGKQCPAWALESEKCLQNLKEQLREASMEGGTE